MESPNKHDISLHHHHTDTVLVCGYHESSIGQGNPAQLNRPLVVAADCRCKHCNANTSCLGVRHVLIGRVSSRNQRVGRYRGAQHVTTTTMPQHIAATFCCNSTIISKNRHIQAGQRPSAPSHLCVHLKIGRGPDVRPMLSDSQYIQLVFKLDSQSS